MKKILGLLISLPVGGGLYFLANDYLTSNQQFILRTLLNVIIQIGFVVALLIVARKNKQLRDILKKHGIDEKSNV